QLLAETAEDYSSPLQLLAKELQFVDPITQEAMHFISEQVLNG
ncbi:MAG: pseudouridine synthase, partial [Moraxellaceae bacterium]